jgi:hypothetical protein
VLTETSADCNRQHADFPARWRCIALHELNLGVSELPGMESNQRILDYAQFANVRYPDDDIPWNGLFVAWVVAQSGAEATLPPNPLQNRSWLQFGSPAETPVPDSQIFIIGGNFNNSVARVGLPKERLLGYRSLTAQPAEEAGNAAAQTAE